VLCPPGSQLSDVRVNEDRSQLRRLLGCRLRKLSAAGLSPRQRSRALWLLVAASTAQLQVFLIFERQMKRTGGPGIIGFELAGTSERARQILDTWGPEGRAAARNPYSLTTSTPDLRRATRARLRCQRRGIRASPPTVPGSRRNAGWMEPARGRSVRLRREQCPVARPGWSRSPSSPSGTERAAQVKFALTSLAQAYILLAGIDAGLARWRQRIGDTA
jgi:hypothetical protein